MATRWLRTSAPRPDRIVDGYSAPVGRLDEHIRTAMDEMSK
ncbi:hypothetical protein [Stenotrophomonas phage CM2]